MSVKQNEKRKIRMVWGLTLFCLVSACLNLIFQESSSPVLLPFKARLEDDGLLVVEVTDSRSVQANRRFTATIGRLEQSGDSTPLRRQDIVFAAVNDPTVDELLAASLWPHLDRLELLNVKRNLRLENFPSLTSLLVEGSMVDVSGKSRSTDGLIQLQFIQKDSGGLRLLDLKNVVFYGDFPEIESAEVVKLFNVSGLSSMEFAVIVRESSGLTELSIWDTDLSFREQVDFSHLKNLKTLKLSGGTLGSVDFGSLQSCENLEQCWILNTTVNADLVIELTESRKFLDLKLLASAFSDEEMRRITSASDKCVVEFVRPAGNEF